MAWQVASYGGGVPLGSTPDEYQGYGRVDLVNALPLERCPYSLFVHESSLRQLQEHRMVVRVSSAAVPLKVTAASSSILLPFFLFFFFFFFFFRGYHPRLP
jgi:hypothetical protein